MRWCLVGPSGSIVRECEAETVHEARLRFRLSGHRIADGWAVLSALSLTVAPVVVPSEAPAPEPDDLGPKPVIGMKAIRTYNACKQRRALTPREREAMREARSDAARKGHEKRVRESPELEEARRAKIGAAMRRMRGEKAKRWEARRQADILRGIERARERRERRANG
jgi:hypothetical protein